MGLAHIFPTSQIVRLTDLKKKLIFLWKYITVKSSIRMALKFEMRALEETSRVNDVPWSRGKGEYRNTVKLRVKDGRWEEDARDVEGSGQVGELCQIR